MELLRAEREKSKKIFFAKCSAIDYNRSFVAESPVNRGGDRATTDGTNGHGNVGDDELLLPLVVKSKLSKLQTREMELTTMATILRSNQHPRALRRG